MKRQLLAASLIAFSVSLAFAAPVKDSGKESAKDNAKNSAKPVAIVNGKPIPASHADLLVAAQTAQGDAAAKGDVRKAVREELIRRQVLLQAAEKKGIDKRSDIQAQVVLSRQSVLINAYLNEYVLEHPVSEDAVKAEYAGIRKMLGDKEYKVRHILVADENAAKAIIEKLDKGERFEDLVKNSQDPGSKERGGDLGWASQAGFVPTFSEAMVKLEKGKYTAAPVKTEYGWHIILLDDIRDLDPPAFDEIKGHLYNRLRDQVVERHIAELRNAAKVE